MKMLDVVIIKDRRKYDSKITIEEFDEILKDKDFYLISKGLVDFYDGTATLYEFNYKKECRIFIWDNR